MSHLNLTNKNYCHPTLFKQLVDNIPTVGRFELFMAKTFGVKRVTTDWTVVVTMYYWRGKYYVTDIT